MLSTPTPFPQVGSYALTEIEGRQHLARIVRRTQGGDTVIALPLLPDVASGNRTVELDALIDGTPLSSFELAELQRLEDEIRAASRPARNKQARAETLRDRLIHAAVLGELMKLLPDPLLRTSRRAA